jgi:hypothetical protein
MSNPSAGISGAATKPQGSVWSEEAIADLMAAIDADYRRGSTALARSLRAKGHAISDKACERRLWRMGLASVRAREAMAETRRMQRTRGEASPFRPTPLAPTATAPEAPEADAVLVGGWRGLGRALEQTKLAMADVLPPHEDERTIVVKVTSDRPKPLLVISDCHLGSWFVDYRLMERITDEILSVPDLGLLVVGDQTQMAIKLRGVAEVSENAVPPKYQMAFLRSWVRELRDRIILSTWDNHASEREDLATGISAYEGVFVDEGIPFFPHIGHPDLVVGQQTYRTAVSHRFRGTANNCAGMRNYVRREYPECELIVQGDSHIPEIAQWIEGGRKKVAVNSGTIQSGLFSRRHFSLRTAAVFPVVTLDPVERIVTPYWSLAEYLRASGRA